MGDLSRDPAVNDFAAFLEADPALDEVGRRMVLAVYEECLASARARRRASEPKLRPVRD